MKCKVDGCELQTTSKKGYCRKHTKKRKTMIYLLEKNIPKKLREVYDELSYKALEDRVKDSPSLLLAIETGRYKL